MLRNLRYRRRHSLCPKEFMLGGIILFVAGGVRSGYIQQKQTYEK